MPIESLNNKQFLNFVSFANKEKATGNATGVARLDGTTTLGDRTITVTKSDHVGKMKRSQDIKNANDDVRAAFKNAIIEMFGDESKIPEDVKKAMLLKDYGVALLSA